MHRKLIMLGVLTFVVLLAGRLSALAHGDGITEEMFHVNNVWMMVSTFLVFIMHLGFACLEAGLTRAKNTTNILFKNLWIIAIGILLYALMGFNLMYPGGEAGGFFGFAGWGINAGDTGQTITYFEGRYTYWTDFLFQAMFAATGATIVSGAVAGRIKLTSFMIFVVLFVGISYPMTGMWKWGNGWLNVDLLKEGFAFHDFAGSSIVHSVGGWGALAGAILLGPRIGKYVGNEIRPIMGHSQPLAMIGVMLLWLGWFGFNGGSVLSAAAGDTSRVLVMTCLAAAAGIIGAIFTSWIIQGKPDLSMGLNGALAGLVGITAAADIVTPLSAVLIGVIAGILVVISVIGFDKMKIDDPVGAISVHLVCGIWGTLAVGIFGVAKIGGLSYKIGLMQQVVGVLAIGAFTFVFAFVVFFILKATIGLRVSEDEELRGLDISEHNMEAYNGFQIFTTQ